MKIISSVFIALTFVLLMSVSSKAQTEIYALGSFNGMLQCCPPCDGPVCEVCNCFDTIETNQVFGFLGETTLYKIDPNSGFSEIIGFTGFRGCQGLDIEPLTGELYAVCNQFEIGPPGPPGVIDETINEEDAPGQVLVKLDKNTGQGTLIGSLGDGIGSRLFGAGFISDIDFRSDGVLFAHLNSNLRYTLVNPAESLSNGVTQNSLGTINLQTGKFDIIGTTGSFDEYSAIGFDLVGDLIQCANNNNSRGLIDLGTNTLPFLHDTDINLLNQDTGNATFLTKAVFPPELQDHVNTITSKDFDTENNIMYGLMTTHGFGHGGTLATNNLVPDGSYLVRLDRSTGDVQLLGQSSGPFEDFLAIAVKGKVRVVPTMSEYGLMLTVALFLGAAVVFLRRRQARSEA